MKYNTIIIIIIINQSSKMIYELCIKHLVCLKFLYKRITLLFPGRETSEHVPAGITLKVFVIEKNV